MVLRGDDFLFPLFKRASMSHGYEKHESVMITKRKVSGLVGLVGLVCSGFYKQARSLCVHSNGCIYGYGFGQDLALVWFTVYGFLLMVSFYDGRVESSIAWHGYDMILRYGN